MLITDQYQNQQQTLHDAGNYGTASIQYAPLVTDILNRMQIRHILDYGSGRKMNLVRHIKPDHKVSYQAYDPGAGLDSLSTPPIPAQMVACIDVLEHVEPDCLDDVLNHLQSLTQVLLFCTVHTGPAMKTLPDGRNAHINQQPMQWWLPKLWERFELQTVQVTGEHQFYVIAYAKPNLLEDADGRKLTA